MLGNAAKSFGSATPAIKVLLAAAPAQKCGPAPNGIASPVFRWTSYKPGFSNTDGSRLAAPYIKNTLSSF